MTYKSEMRSIQVCFGDSHVIYTELRNQLAAIFMLRLVKGRRENILFDLSLLESFRTASLSPCSDCVSLLRSAIIAELCLYF